MKMKENSRNNNFGVLHILAALFVLYGHQCALLGEGTPLICGSQIQAIGVKIIFLISGYLIMKSLFSQEGSALKISSVYVVKRIGRLYPEYIFCILITALVIGPLFTSLQIGEYFADVAVRNYIINNILLFVDYNLPGMFGANPYMGAVNGSLWTMPVEVFTYVVFLVFCLVIKKLKVSKHIYGVFTVTVSIVFLSKFVIFPEARLVIYGTDWMSALNVIPYMFLGGAFYFYDMKKYLNVQLALCIFLGFSSICFNTQVINEFMCLLIIPYVVFSLGFAKEQYLNLRFIKGEYAYGLYLWGFVVQQCLIQTCYVENRILTTRNFLFVASCVITYILAMISYEVIYAPFCKWNKKWIGYLQRSL